MPEPIPGFSHDIGLVDWLRPYFRHGGVSHRPPWRIKSRKLLDYLVVYIDKGRGRFTVGSESHEAREGDLFWIPPDTPHDMEGFAPSMDLVYAHLDLRYRPGVSHWDFSIPAGTLDLGELAPLMHPPPPAGPLGSIPGLLRSPAMARAGALLHEVCAEAALGQPYASLRISGLLTELLALLLRACGSLEGDGSTHLAGLELAAGHLARHCQRPVPLSEAARVAGLSTSHFRKLFRAQFGCSPRDYLRRARIQKAKNLMAEHRQSLTELADALGFANVHSFSRAFRAVEGKSPSAWRRFGRNPVRVEGRRRPYAG